MSQTQGSHDDPLQWTTIADFSQGIIANSNFAFGAGAANAVPATQIGAAQQSGTYNCMALPSGGLGPLPGEISNVVTGQTGTVVGAIAYGPISSSPYLPNGTGGDEIDIAYENFTGTHRRLTLYGWQEWDAKTFLIYDSTSLASTITGWLACSMTLTEFNSDLTTDPGYPRVVFSPNVLQTISPSTAVMMYPQWESGRGRGSGRVVPLWRDPQCSWDLGAGSPEPGGGFDQCHLDLDPNSDRWSVELFLGL